MALVTGLRRYLPPIEPPKTHPKTDIPAWLRLPVCLVKNGFFPKAGQVLVSDKKAKIFDVHSRKNIDRRVGRDFFVL